MLERRAEDAGRRHEVVRLEGLAFRYFIRVAGERVQRRNDPAPERRYVGERMGLAAEIGCLDRLADARPERGRREAPGADFLMTGELSDEVRELHPALSNARPGPNGRVERGGITRVAHAERYFRATGLSLSTDTESIARGNGGRGICLAATGQKRRGHRNRKGVGEATHIGSPGKGAARQ